MVSGDPDQMIGKPHRSKGPGRQVQLPGDVSLYRQVNIDSQTSTKSSGSSRVRVVSVKGLAKKVSPVRTRYSKEQKESLKRAIKSYRDLSIPVEKPDGWLLEEIEYRGAKVIKEVDVVGGKVFRFVPVHNKTALIFTWIFMFYILASQVSAAEAPTTVGEIVSSTASVQLVKHDPVNFDAADAKETKPNVDSSIHPAAAETVDGGNKLVSAVDGVIASTEAPVEVPKPVYIAGNVANHFPWGYCTWYVASKRSVPWIGNAITWYSQAIAYGFTVGNAPAVGAIMVTRESSLGHVAYVEAVNPDGSWVVSEMNYVGFGVISSRTVHPGAVPVIGFVY